MPTLDAILTRASTLPTPRALLLALALGLAVLPVAPRAGNKDFSSGSLIIPAQMEYQDSDNQMASAYGLVYTLLLKNATQTHPFTIYWIVEPNKQSHHRCWIAHGDGHLPSYGTYNDDDGCDFTVQSATGRPVSLLKADFTLQQNFPVYSTLYDSSASATSGNVTRGTQFNVDAGHKLMKYSGGLWVIDARDVPAVLELLKNDADLRQYHAGGTCGNPWGCHYVQIHSANAGFSAPVARALTERTPEIAFMGAGNVSLMEDYLQEAGLTNLTCYRADLSNWPAAPTNWGNEPSAGYCANTLHLSHGVIYDIINPLLGMTSYPGFDHGWLNAPVDTSDLSKGNVYQILWAPDWNSLAQAQCPPDGAPGDEVIGDGKWTYAGDTCQTNAFKNISYFVDQGYALMAEADAVPWLEGSWKTDPAACPYGQLACELSTDPTQNISYTCANGYTAACNACYSCAAGGTLDVSNCNNVTCGGTCTAGAQYACGKCFTCPADEPILSASDCNNVQCLADPNTCPSGYTSACGGCFACDTGYTLVGTSCPVQCVPSTCPSGYLRAAAVCTAPYAASSGQCVQCPSSYALSADNCFCTKSGKPNAAPTLAVGVPKQIAQSVAPTYSTMTGTVPSQQPASCPASYQMFCEAPAGTRVDLGSPYTKFQVSDGVVTNGLGNSFSGPDCNDGAATVSHYHNANTDNGCFNYHPETGAPGNVISQHGNFNYEGSTGNVHTYQPAATAPSQYWPNVFQIATSVVAGNAASTGWDFASFRHKDSDPTKGLVVYMAGNDYKFRLWGLRVILNALLALGQAQAGTEIARSEPVGYHDVTGSTAVDRVYQGTYLQKPDPQFPDWWNYTVASTQSWRFPYTTGHLYEYDLDNIPTSSTRFSCVGVTASGSCPMTNWDAAARMPLPGNRQMFTVLGGSAHLGWKKVNFRYTETQDGCFHYAGDTKCALSEALAACATAGVNTSTLLPYGSTDASAVTQQNVLGMFVQQVRGFCSSTPAINGTYHMEPSDAQCDDLRQQSNRATLGGLDHGSPAIVGPSRYVTGPAWANRPVVAYAGARDGMLHAFYVSGGTGWADPSGTGLPSGIQRGQELWAFIPPGQLCGLATNNAMVDASVNVIDVLGNFPNDANGDGVIDWSTGSTELPNGIQTWRTVLVAAVGQGGSELFALDITNPLKPVLLWHLAGPSEHDNRWDANANGSFADSGDQMSKLDPTTYALKWFDWDDDDATTAHIPSDYNTSSTTIFDALKFGRFDYRNLGLTYGTAIGKIWEGNAYRYVAYITTTAADYTNTSTPTGYKGVEVFAIDLVTGQKIWQWERMYRRSNGAGNVIADNSIPGRAALADVDADGSVDRIYVGDMEGHLWELNAADGRNMNYLAVTLSSSTTGCASTSPPTCSFPLFGTADLTAGDAPTGTIAAYTVAGGGALAQQPLTSPIGLGRFTDVKTSLVPYLQGRLAVVQGTMGVDWGIAWYNPGHMYVVPVYEPSGTRLPIPVDLSAHPEATLRGVITPPVTASTPAVWDIPLDVGERVYGMPRVVNNRVLFNTAFGSFTGDISDSVRDYGNFVVASKTDDSAPAKTPNTSKSFGGVLIVGGKVVVSTSTGINQVGTVPADLTSGGIPELPFNRNTPAIMKTWEPIPNATAPYLNQ